MSAVVLCAGYIIAVASVVCISGGWTQIMLRHYLSIQIPWQILSAVLTFGAMYLIVAGAKPSTNVAAVFFAFELVLLLAIAIALLVQHSGSINLKPFDPSNLHRGFCRSASRWRSTCSSAGRTRRPWRRRPRTRAARSRGRCSRASG